MAWEAAGPHEQELGSAGPACRLARTFISRFSRAGSVWQGQHSLSSGPSQTPVWPASPPSPGTSAWLLLLLCPPPLSFLGSGATVGALVVGTCTRQPMGQEGGLAEPWGP